MTDYGQFYETDSSGNRFLKKDHIEVTYGVEKKSERKDKCSTASITKVIEYAKKLNELRLGASKEGVCLDELEEAAKAIAK